MRCYRTAVQKQGGAIRDVRGQVSNAEERVRSRFLDRRDSHNYSAALTPNKGCSYRTNKEPPMRQFTIAIAFLCCGAVAQAETFVNIRMEIDDIGGASGAAGHSGKRLCVRREVLCKPL